MARIPREKSLDSTLALRSDPYRFISRKCRELGSDLFSTRIFLRRTVCMTGVEAARLFYDEERFTREGGQPARVQKSLLGQGGVQGLDGEEHRHRKAMFLSIMAPEEVDRLRTVADEVWREQTEKWTSRERVVFYDEARELLARAVCRWASVPLPEDEVERRTRGLSALYEGAGDMGPRHWWSRIERKRMNAWAEDLIEAVRDRSLEAPEGSALKTIADHRGRDGEPLDREIAAVELLNVLRPTVAVSVYLVFVAHALHMHPAIRERVRTSGDDYRTAFVQEVRRTYPFFPATAARVRKDFSWKGYRFPEGRRVMLDLHGIDHDPRVWEAPETFRPERFLDHEPDPYAFVPQGGGTKERHHRCAGEEVAIALMEQTAGWLTRQLEYDVPHQELALDLTRLPALPGSGFTMEQVRPTGTVGRGHKGIVRRVDRRRG